jgi:hypothetical protein
VLLFLTERVMAAQSDELRYAEPLMAHPPTAAVIQHQGRHNRDVGMTVDPEHSHAAPATRVVSAEQPFARGRRA